MNEAEQIMKRCQAGTRNYNEANNLHAACYGMIGKLLMKLKELESQDHIEQRLEMVKQKHKNNIWAKQLSAAQRNELSQIEDGTWEADRNG